MVSAVRYLPFCLESALGQVPPPLLPCPRALCVIARPHGIVVAVYTNPVIWVLTSCKGLNQPIRPRQSAPAIVIYPSVLPRLASLLKSLICPTYSVTPPSENPSKPRSNGPKTKQPNRLPASHTACFLEIHPVSIYQHIYSSKLCLSAPAQTHIRHGFRRRRLPHSYAARPRCAPAQR